MERIIKIFESDWGNLGQSGRSAAQNMFNSANEWLQSHVSPLESTANSHTQASVSRDYNHFAKVLLEYLRTRGKRTELMDNTKFVCVANGTGWQTAYITALVNNVLMHEVVIGIDDPTHAVHYKLAHSE